MPRRNKEIPVEYEPEPAPILDSRVDDLIAWTEPLLELFSVVDDVMTEDDWNDPGKRGIALGRIRRSWQSAVKVLKEET